jgi:hypothetical protein
MATASGAKTIAQGAWAVGKNALLGYGISQGANTVIYAAEGKDISQSILSPTEALKAGAQGVVFSGVLGVANKALGLTGKGVEVAVERTAVAGVAGVAGGGIAEYIETGKVTPENLAISGVQGVAFGAVSEGAVAANSKYDVTGKIRKNVQGIASDMPFVSDRLETIQTSYDMAFQKGEIPKYSKTDKLVMKATGSYPSKPSTVALPTVETANIKQDPYIIRSDALKTKEITGFVDQGSYFGYSQAPKLPKYQLTELPAVETVAEGTMRLSSKDFALYEKTLGASKTVPMGKVVTSEKVNTVEDALNITRGPKTASVDPIYGESLPAQPKIEGPEFKPVEAANKSSEPGLSSLKYEGGKLTFTESTYKETYSKSGKLLGFSGKETAAPISSNSVASLGSFNKSKLETFSLESTPLKSKAVAEAEALKAQFEINNAEAVVTDAESKTIVDAMKSTPASKGEYWHYNDAATAQELVGKTNEANKDAAIGVSKILSDITSGEGATVPQEQKKPLTGVGVDKLLSDIMSGGVADTGRAKTSDQLLIPLTGGMMGSQQAVNPFTKSSTFPQLKRKVTEQDVLVSYSVPPNTPLQGIKEEQLLFSVPAQSARVQQPTDLLVNQSPIGERVNVSGYSVPVNALYPIQAAGTKTALTVNLASVNKGINVGMQQNVGIENASVLDLGLAQEQAPAQISELALQSVAQVSLGLKMPTAQISESTLNLKDQFQIGFVPIDRLRTVGRPSSPFDFSDDSKKKRSSKRIGDVFTFTAFRTTSAPKQTGVEKQVVRAKLVNFYPSTGRKIPDSVKSRKGPNEYFRAVTINGVHGIGEFQGTSQSVSFYPAGGSSGSGWNASKTQRRKKQ